MQKPKQGSGRQPSSLQASKTKAPKLMQIAAWQASSALLLVGCMGLTALDLSTETPPPTPPRPNSCCRGLEAAAKLHETHR